MVATPAVAVVVARRAVAVIPSPVVEAALALVVALVHVGVSVVAPAGVVAVAPKAASDDVVGSVAARAAEGPLMMVSLVAVQTHHRA